MKSRSSVLKMVLIIIAVFAAIGLLRWVYLNAPRTAIDVDESLLLKVVKPGKYVGEGVYSPTPLYKNGLTTENVLVITENKTEKNISYVNELIARDSKTNEIQYKGTRKGKYFYKPTHGSNLFNTSETFVDGQVVSTSYGYATAKTDNSIDFHINCAWHIIDAEYNNVSKDLKRVGDVLYGTFTHPGFFGGDTLTFHEKYVQE